MNKDMKKYDKELKSFFNLLFIKLF